MSEVYKKLILPQPIRLLWLRCHVSSNLIVIFVVLLFSSVICISDFEQNNFKIKFSYHGFELTQSNNLQRQEILQKYCESEHHKDREQYSDLEDLASNVIDDYDHLIVDEKYKFLYCYVPKVSKYVKCNLNYSFHTKI